MVYHVYGTAGNLNGAMVTVQGEPGVIVQQGGSPIVQQAGGASPIVQGPSAPLVQQNPGSPATMVVQQTPTVVQQPFPAAPSIPRLPPIGEKLLLKGKYCRTSNVFSLDVHSAVDFAHHGISIPGYLSAPQ